MSGGASDGGSPPQSKKFRLRSKSCPARILGPNPASYFETETPRKNWFEESDGYYDSDRHTAIDDLFAKSPPRDSPVPSVPSQEYPSVFESDSGSDQYDIAPDAVQFLLDTVSFRLSELVRLNFLKEVKEEESA